MLFSAKISHSFLKFLESEGAEVDAALDLSPVPLEKLRDPFGWIEANQLEHYLQFLDQEFGQKDASKSSLALRVGMSCEQIRAWGALDSVLKMMSSPVEIFRHPERFLSYFISPAPPLNLLHQATEKIAFEVPVLASHYPMVTQFLQGALSALPLYQGRDLAVVTWRESRVDISFEQTQSSFFEIQDHQLHVRPDLLRSLMTSLEESQRELERLNRVLVEKDQKIELLKEAEVKTKTADAPLAAKTSEVKNSIRHQVLRLQDYFVRSQQLITLLVAQGRMDSQVRKAMKKVDWDRIQKDFPLLVEDLKQALSKEPKTEKSEIEKSIDSTLGEGEIEAPFPAFGQLRLLQFSMGEKNHGAN